MKPYIVFDQQGTILRTGSCPANHVDLQAGPGEYVIEGVAQDDLHMIVDGQIVDKPPPPPPTQAQLLKICMAKIKAIRKPLLAATDFTQLPDSPLSDDQKAAYQTYRQQLRDLPATYADATSIDEVVFPTEPSR